MLDELHDRIPQSHVDHNVYNLGSINGHNIVVVGLPSTGNNPAATVVIQMRNTFRSLRFCLLVGRGGGVPVESDSGPIRFEDVVVSKPVAEYSGAVQYDRGKAEASLFRRTGCLHPPPTVLLNAAQGLAPRRALANQDPLDAHLQRINTKKRELRKFRFPGRDKDHLYEPD